MGEQLQNIQAEILYVHVPISQIMTTMHEDHIYNNYYSDHTPIKEF